VTVNNFLKLLLYLKILSCYTDVMSESSESDKNYQRILIEQKKIQSGKYQSRLVDEYNQYIFLGKSLGGNETSDVEEFTKSLFGGGADNLEGLLEGLIRKRGRNIRWTDMGGGRGLTMRQLALSQKLKGRVEMGNVDINNYDLSGLDKSEITYLENKYPGITKDNVRPNFIRGNAETIRLSKPADLITSVEVMQYLDHPVAALCDWYNQLENGGIMVISAEHAWSDWIRYEGSTFSSDPHPFEKVLEIFDQNHIPYAVSNYSYRHGSKPKKDTKREFRNLVIQKVKNTSLAPASPVKKVWYNPHSYKAVYYEKNSIPIEVVKGNNVIPSLNQRYAEQVSNIIRE